MPQLQQQEQLVGQLLEGVVETPKQRSRRLADEKANNQLRQNRRTASHKLSRLILFSLLKETGRCTCARCNKDLTEDSFSIDHMENWLDSEDPRSTFFDIKNIDFSCKLCNTSHNRGKFGIRVVEEKVWTVRKPLLHAYEVESLTPEPSPFTKQVTLFEKFLSLFYKS